jgi:hypothetical protein
MKYFIVLLGLVPWLYSLIEPFGQNFQMILILFFGTSMFIFSIVRGLGFLPALLESLTAAAVIAMIGSTL